MQDMVRIKLEGTEGQFLKDFEERVAFCTIQLYHRMWLASFDLGDIVGGAGKERGKRKSAVFPKTKVCPVSFTKLFYWYKNQEKCAFNNHSFGAREKIQELKALSLYMTDLDSTPVPHLVPESPPKVIYECRIRNKPWELRVPPKQNKKKQSLTFNSFIC